MIKLNIKLLTLGLLTMLCFECSSKTPAGANQVEPITGIRALVRDSALLVDVRTPEEFEAGHVDGSVNIPLASIEANLAQLEGKKHIVVFCRSGNRSAKAAALLKEHGFTNVTDAGAWTKVQEELAK